MKLLLDTHLLLWLVGTPEALSAQAKALIADLGNDLFFSPISIFEVAIKNAKGRSDFRADASELRDTLLLHEVVELPLLSSHAVRVSDLPQLHNDPFDRLLLAQALEEGMFLLTADTALTRYSTNVLDAR